MRGLSRILLACVVVATFDQPIGMSMQGFVLRHAVSWCPDYYTGAQLMIERSVVTPKGETVGGKPTMEFYPLPQPTPMIPTPAAPPPTPTGPQPLP